MTNRLAMAMAGAVASYASSGRQGLEKSEKDSKSRWTNAVTPDK